MATPAKKRKNLASEKKKRTTTEKTKINENLDCLLELNKLQVVLLEQLCKDLR